MRIAYLTSAYARASDTFIRGEVAELRRLGHEVHTFSIRRPDVRELVSDEIRREHAATEFIVNAGLPRLALAWLRTCLTRPRSTWRAALLSLASVDKLKGWPWSIAYWIEAAYLAEQLRAKNIEHLHNHIGENSATVAMLAAMLAEIPYSLTIHGPGEFDRPTDLALNEKVGRAAFTVAVCEFGRSQIYRWTHHDHWPRVHVVRCGLDRSFLEAPATNVPADRRLVCVGRLAEQKGQLLLVEAARTLAAEGLDFEIAIVGDGPLRGPIEATIAKYGLASHVRLLGWQNGEQVREAILRSRALVLPSFAEGLPVVLMEALALGRPVISTYVAGIPELVDDGRCGWLVHAGNLDGLTRAMREALTLRPAELDAMGRAGAERVAHWHDAAHEAAKLAELFQRDRNGDTTAARPMLNIANPPRREIDSPAIRTNAPLLTP